MRLNILHVEDDEDDVFLLQRAFSRAKFECSFSHVKNGEEAIQYLSGAGPFSSREAYVPPDVVLLDLKLPGKNGFDVLEWTRAQPRLKHLPIIIMTSSDRPEDLQRAFSLGATSYLNKSVSCENVMSLLPTLLKPKPEASEKA